MMRYAFLMLAFFLTNTTLASGFLSGITSTVVANVNSTPDLRSNRNASVPDVRKKSNRSSATATDIKRTSPRNTTEVGSAMEPAVLGTGASDTQLNNNNGSRHAPATKTTKTSANSMSCKTYEGKIYDQGEAGYNDCIRNIRTDRQGARTVP